jgi:hypothetical protein
MSTLVSKEDEIAQVRMQRPHVVILGAGASIAACPTGDASGKPLPSMADFIEKLNLGPILAKANIEYCGRNFEEIYAAIFESEKLAGIRSELENVVYNFFESLKLPDIPTLYDHLVLSLREKDCIATFNWDPFLIQAYQRNYRFSRPRLIFLHGNVMVGYCDADRVMGINGRVCRRCQKPYTPTQLLYPITQKNYQEDHYIREGWTELSAHLKNACLLTIFGYGAPRSDVAAIDLLKSAWGPSGQRSMEQIEIINILPEKELVRTWEPFIHSHHYDISADFYSSWLANHPRRTGEAYLSQFIDAGFIENNPLPRRADFPELWNWINRHALAEEHDQKKHAMTS